MNNLTENNLLEDVSLSQVLTTLLKQEPELLSMPEGSFPTQLWQRLAEEKLLFPGLSDSLGGQESSSLAIAQAAKTLTYLSGSAGLGMSWVMQQALVNILVKSDKQQLLQDHLPSLLNGKGLCALSISEPGAGAHPKRLSAHAKQEGENYLLNGEKTYISNGPVADIFIILAITDIVNERKQFTAFLVPKDTPGLTIVPMKSFDALKPSSHCGLKLENCAIPALNILGKKGQAFDTISKPFREHEDILMLSPLAGAMQALLNKLIEFKPNILPAEDLGALLAIIDSVSALANQAAQQLDTTKVAFEPVSFIIIGRQLIEQFILKIKPLEIEHALGPAIKNLINDIDVLVNIAKTANTAKQKALATNYLATFTRNAQ